MAKLSLPEGHHTVTPGCSVPGAAKVISFLESAFDGKVVDRFDGQGGSVMHAEVRLGDSVVMVGDTMPGNPPMPAVLSYYVADGPAVDRVYRRALDNGAESITEPQDRFYGYRSATVRDPGGNQWSICAVIEQLTHQEIEQRMAEMMAGS